MMDRVNKPCEGCGEIMENVSHLRKFCHACRKKRQDAYNTKYREAHRAPKTGKEHCPPILNPNAKHCEGCMYWYGKNDGCDVCNYIFVEGKRRPCPPGKDCTVKKAKKKSRHRYLYGSE